MNAAAKGKYKPNPSLLDSVTKMVTGNNKAKNDDWKKGPYLSQSDESRAQDQSDAERYGYTERPYNYNYGGRKTKRRKTNRRKNNKRKTIKRKQKR